MFVKKLTKQAICNPDDPVVKTPDGKLRGVIVDDTYIFRGIKYADAIRFHEPTQVKPWDGIKEAIIYGPVCPEINTVQPDDNYNVPHVFYPQDEDCQYLNVWTQKINDETAKRPVLLWLHGGGMATGSGIEHFAYDGENMSRFGNVVVVTLNHRLNILGFFDLSKYGEQYKHSGNVGMLDIVEALRWIKRNIASFGGDPDNVTIFGQSGGGGKVATLLQMPPADGLFHRAVIQSGVMKEPPGGRPAPKDNSGLILDALGITPDRIEEIEKVPYYKFQQIIPKLGPGAGMGFGPHKDGEVYLGSIFESGICEHAKTVPVLVGNVTGEFFQNYVFTIDDGRKNTWSPEKAEKIIRSVLGDAADEGMKLQKAAYPTHKVQDILFTDRQFRSGTIAYLQARAAAGCKNTYGFMFAMEQPMYGGTLPWHNAEIPYVFHNADYIEPSYLPGVTEKVQDIVCGAWCNFAEKGDPNVVGAPDWQPYTNERHSMMYFDEESVERPADDEEALLDFFAAHPFQLTRVTRQKRAKYFGGGPRV